MKCEPGPGMVFASAVHRGLGVNIDFAVTTHFTFLASRGPSLADLILSCSNRCTIPLG